MDGWIFALGIIIGAVSGAPSYDAGDNTVLCDVCHVIVQQVKTLVNKEQTKEQAISYLENVCIQLPDAEKELCRDFIYSKSPKVFTELLSHLDSTEVCFMLPNVCPGRKQEVPLLVEEAEEEPVILKSEPIHENMQDTLECELCKFIVTSVDNLLGNNKTEAAINSTLMKICNSLPGELGQLCMQVEPNLVKALENGFDPQKACTAVKLCKTAGMKFDLPCDLCYTVMAEIGVKDAEKICSGINSCRHETDIEQEKQVIHPEEPEDTLECELCKFIVTSVDNLLGNNKTEAAINSTLMKICNSLPGELGQLCMQVEPNLVKALENGFDPQKACTAVKLCKTAGMKFDLPCDLCYTVMAEIGVKDAEKICSGINSCRHETDIEQEKQVIHPEEPEDTLECELCKFIVTSVDNLLGNNKTEAAINSTLMKICNSLPGELGQLCMQVEPNLVKALENGFDPQKACTAVKLCKTAGKFDLPCDLCYTVIAEIGVKDAEKICSGMNSCRHETDIEQEKQVILPEEPEDTLECELCKFIVTSVDNLLGNNKTEAAINSTLMKICNSLPGELGQLCMQVEPNLVKALENGFDPQKACTAVKLCKTALRKFDLPCDLCYTVIAEIGVKDAEKICSGMNSCRHETDIEQEKQVILPEEPEDTLECELCKFIVTSVDNLLGNNKTEAAINSTLMKICNSLPGELGQLCMQVEPNLVKALENGFDPQKACTAVKLCKTALRKFDLPCDLCDTVIAEIGVKDAEKICSGMNSCRHETDIEQEKQVILPEEPEDTLECELCKFIVTSVDNLLGNNKTEAAINSTLMKICNSLPGELGQLCMQVEPNLVKALENGFDPQKACTAVKLCKTALRKFDLPCDLCDTVIAEIGVKDAEKICSGMNSCRHETDIEQEKQVILPEEPEDTLECELCKFIVTSVDNLLGNNKTEAAINSTLMKICNSLPGELGQLCMQVEPNLVKALENGFDPQKACTAVKLCKTGVEKSINPAYIPCDVCQSALEVVAGEKGVEACFDIPGVCLYEREVETNTPASSQHEPPKANAKCELCKFMVELLKTYLAENATEEKINNTLNSICDSLPEDTKEMCQGAAQVILKAMKNGVNPATACQDTKFCPASASWINLPEMECDTCHHFLVASDPETFVEEVVNLLCNQACHHRQRRSIKKKAFIDVTKEFPGLSKKGKLQKSPRLNADIKCDLCRFAVTELDTLLGKNRTDAAINATLNSICEKLPGELSSLCKQAIPSIMKAVENGFDPDKACTTAKLCNEASAVFLTEEVTPNEETGASTIGCDICEFLVSEADTMLKENKSKDALNTTLFKVCERLPADIKLTCEVLVPQIVIVLANGANPKKACSAIHLCTGSKNVHLLQGTQHKETQQKEPEQSIGCEICQFLVTEADQELEKNKTIAALNSTLYKTCAKLPKSYALFCDLLVPEIISLLAKGLSPKNVCIEMHLCTNSSAVHLLQGTQHKETQQKEPEQSIGCEICQFLVTEADQELEKNKTIAALNSTLYKTCAKLPKSYALFCDLLVPEIISLLAKGLSPKNVCIEMHLCTNSSAAAKKPNEDPFSAVIKSLEPPAPWDCHLCRKVMEFVDDDLVKNYEKIRGFIVGNICNKLPDTTSLATTPKRSIKEMCLYVAENLIPLIVNTIFIPNVFCVNTGICPDVI